MGTNLTFGEIFVFRICLYRVEPTHEARHEYLVELGGMRLDQYLDSLNKGIEEALTCHSLVFIVLRVSQIPRFACISFCSLFRQSLLNRLFISSPFDFFALIGQ